MVTCRIKRKNKQQDKYEEKTSGHIQAQFLQSKDEEEILKEPEKKSNNLQRSSNKTNGYFLNRNYKQVRK